MTFDSFEKSLSDRAIKRGGLLLYRHNDALQLVEHCNQNNVRILGIDAFFVLDGKTHPKIEHSIDLSDCNIMQANAIAYQFLQKRSALDLVYEIVY